MQFQSTVIEGTAVARRTARGTAWRSGAASASEGVGHSYLHGPAIKALKSALRFYNRAVEAVIISKWCAALVQLTPWFWIRVHAMNNVPFEF